MSCLMQLRFVFQSTLPREERQTLMSQFIRQLKISIHAPTRGATPENDRMTKWYDISIHAPTRGATWSTYIIEYADLAISIHAPTRGATGAEGDPLILAGFQSTLPREERLQGAFFVPKIRNFNPRSHERSDESDSIEVKKLVYFNPRSHERSDLYSY